MPGELQAKGQRKERKRARAEGRLRVSRVPPLNYCNNWCYRERGSTADFATARSQRILASQLAPNSVPIRNRAPGLLFQIGSGAHPCVAATARSGHPCVSLSAPMNHFACHAVWQVYGEGEPLLLA
jgi:hypothetical protein